MTNFSFFNLSSDRSLDHSPFLGFGHRFSPQPADSTFEDLSLTRLERHTYLADFFSTNTLNSSRISPLKVPSTWTPPVNEVHPYLPQLHLDLRIEIASSFNNRTRTFSSPDQLTKAIKDLAARPDVKCVLSDKNLGIVALDTVVYDTLVKRHLLTRTYERTHERKDDGLFFFDLEYYELGQEVRAYLKKRYSKDDDVLAFLLDSDLTLAKFHVIVKLHKKILADGTYPTRPIIGCRPDNLFSRLSQVITEALTPHVKTRKHVILENVTELIDEIEYSTFDPKTQLLVTIDFDSLYSNIPLPDLLKVIKDNGYLDDTQLRLLEYVLLNNYCEYNGEVYRQLIGIAMGTSSAPPLANLYLYTKFDLPAQTMPRISNFKRFIDDVFLKYTGSMDQFLESIAELRRIAHPLGITYTVSNQSVDYLDATFYHHREFLVAKTFYKPISKHSFLPPMSCHPRQTIAGYIKGEVIRMRRTCTLNAPFNEAMDTFRRRLLARGFTNSELDSILLFDYERYRTPRPKQASNDFYLTTPYSQSPVNRDIKRILRENHPTLQSIFPKFPTKITLAYSQPPNIARLLLRSAISPTQSRYLEQYETETTGTQNA
jgi:hypothetical protein